MREGFVGFCHLVGVFPFLDGCALSIEGIEDFSAEFFDHGLAGSLSCVGDHPPNGECSSSVWSYFHGDLVGLSSDSSGSYFCDGHAVL